MYRSTTDPNVVFPSKGSQMSNPFGNYMQMTYPQQMNAGLHNFNQAFQDNRPIIEKQNFANQNNLLHNNVGRNLMLESTQEYVIDIDSYNRTTTTYLDPFSYVVSFNPSIPAIAPYLHRTFKNVKYVRVDSVILPKYYAIKDNGGSWELDTDKDLSKERYVVLKMKNLDSIRNLSTNNIVESNGIKLIPDTIPLSSNFYYAIPANNSNIIQLYNDSLLGNLSRLDVAFYDSYGAQLAYTNLTSSVATTDVRNPLNKNLQNDITISLGVVENEMNTEVKFNQ